MKTIVRKVDYPDGSALLMWGRFRIATLKPKGEGVCPWQMTTANGKAMCFASKADADAYISDAESIVELV